MIFLLQHGYESFESQSAEETEALGLRLAQIVKSGDVVALYGSMGAGKTAFVRGFVKGMGINDLVTSPTYTIVHEYCPESPLSPCVFHFDMFRLSSSEDLFEIGWDDYLSRDGVCIVEWSENIKDALPRSRIDVTISAFPNTGDVRRIEIRRLP